jgi:hypothetical protein
VEAAEELAGFRRELHRCLTARADALFELTDALLCTDVAAKSLVGLSLAPEHRRGHGAMYDALNQGRIDVQRLRTTLSGLALPCAVDGRLMLVVDVSAGCGPTPRRARIGTSLCQGVGGREVSVSRIMVR